MNFYIIKNNVKHIFVTIILNNKFNNYNYYHTIWSFICIKLFTMLKLNIVFLFKFQKVKITKKFKLICNIYFLSENIIKLY